MTKLRTLLFSTLFPNAERPGHGVFVETRLRKLLDSGQVETTVMAPVPWFFSTHPRYGTYARFARVPPHEQRHGIQVLHPRYLLLPKVGMNLTPFTLALACVGEIRRMIREGRDFDVIDAHYFYPDGVAAALLAKWFDKRVCITARGSDLTQISHYAVPRRLMQWAARRADASIGVCNALVDVIRPWGVDPLRLHMIRNGVDLERFRPMSREESRRDLSLAGAPLILSVGNLVELKGHDLSIDALAMLVTTHSEASLVIVGEGPERDRLMQHAEAAGMASRVRFAGRVDNRELARWYSAADVLLLSSSREGWANVLLEAMACGTPVVATRVGGSPEVVASARAGVLVDERTPASIAASVRSLLAAMPSRQEVRAYAEDFSWDGTTEAQLRLFSSLAASA